MQCSFYLSKQQKEYVVRCVGNKKHQFFLKMMLLTFSFFLSISNLAYGDSTDQQKKLYKTVFVIEEALSDQGVGWLVKTPMKALQFLQKKAPNMLVEMLHEYSFKTTHKHLGENDNIRKTFFSSIPGLKEVIAIYSGKERVPETAEKNPLFITLSGMLKHLEDKSKTEDPQFQALLKTLNTPMDTTKWYIYDGGTADEAINNVAMEFYHTVKRWGNSVRNMFSGKKSNHAEININALFERCFQDLYLMDQKLPDSVKKRYIVTLQMKSPVSDKSNDVEGDETHSVEDNRTYRGASSKSLSKAMGILFGVLTAGQYIGAGAAMTIPPSLVPGPATYTGTSSCLSSGGHCIPVGNANITSLMTNNLKGNFVAVEDIDGNTILQNSNTTAAAVPGEFSGTFSTGVYSLNGFPVNGTIPFLESVNNSHIECNVPIKNGTSPGNVQPLLTRRALHANKVEATLQWPEISADVHHTPPVTGSIEGNHNKFIVKNKLLRRAGTLYWAYNLQQKDTGIIATEVSGDHNHLEYQGEVRIFKTVNNDVPGNIAKTISGIDNKLIQKGPFEINEVLNGDKIALTRNRFDNSIDSFGLLELYVPVKGTNTSQWGTVCSEGFSHQNSIVACRYLGFDTGYQNDTDYEYSEQHVLLSNVRCIGNETSLLQCPHNFTNEHNCNQPPVEIRCTREKNYNNNTVLYAGILGRAPESIANIPVAFLDRAGYLDFGLLSKNNSVDSTKPNDWRTAQQHLCVSEKCDISCHYVNEQFHSVINNGNKTYLVTRQHYPAVMFFPFLNASKGEAEGLIRITDISQPGANGTVQLHQPPADNPYLGARNLSDPSVYTPSVSKIVINNTLLSLHRRPAFFKFSNLNVLEPNDEASGVQLSEVSLDGTNSTYNSISYDFPGENALLLNENAVFTYNETDHTIIQRSLNNNGQHYTIGDADVTYQLPPEPLIATGTDGNFMYVVTKEQDSGNFTTSKNLIFSRYNLKNNEKDVSWNRLVQPNDLFEEAGDYQLSFVGDEIRLLRRYELFSLDGVPYSLQIPQGGGCSEIHKGQALQVSVEKTNSHVTLHPALSSASTPIPTSNAIFTGVVAGVLGTVIVLQGILAVVGICKMACEAKKRNHYTDLNNEYP